MSLLVVNYQFDIILQNKAKEVKMKVGMPKLKIPWKCPSFFWKKYHTPIYIVFDIFDIPKAGIQLTSIIRIISWSVLFSTHFYHRFYSISVSAPSPSLFPLPLRLRFSSGPSPPCNIQPISRSLSAPLVPESRRVTPVYVSSRRLSPETNEIKMLR